MNRLLSIAAATGLTASFALCTVHNLAMDLCLNNINEKRVSRVCQRSYSTKGGVGR